MTEQTKIKKPEGQASASCTGSVWIETAKQKPEAYLGVIGWDEQREYSICYWIDRGNVDGGQWSVNRESGWGIKPPTFWMKTSDLPNLPNVKDEPP